MHHGRGRRAVATTTISGMVAALLSAAVLTFAAAPAGAVTANDDASFRLAYEDEAVSEIDVTADIQMDCAEGDFHRNADPGEPLTINGNGHTITAAGCGDQVLYNSLGPLTVNDLVITGGDYTGAGSVAGSGIQNGGNTTLVRSSVTGNTVTTTGAGGGNFAGGAGISGGEGSTITLIRSSITGNTASCTGSCSSAEGAGIYTEGTVVLVNSTVSGNVADGNESTSRGGGIYSPLSVSLVYSTVAGNAADFGANVFALELTSFASVVALPAGGGENCSLEGGTSDGYSYDDDGSCDFDDATGDVSDGPDPLLGALETVGILPVHTPQTGSPLIDAIPTSACSDDGASDIVPLVDEVSTSRPQLTGCDIGAIEVPAPPAPPAPEPVDLEPNFTG